MNIVKNTSNNFIRMICICKLFVCCTKLYNRTFYTQHLKIMRRVSIKIFLCSEIVQILYRVDFSGRDI